MYFDEHLSNNKYNHMYEDLYGVHVTTGQASR
jgi:hypothetical protein